VSSPRTSIGNIHYEVVGQRTAMYRGISDRMTGRRGRGVVIEQDKQCHVK
jgi:hypothetical protein